MDGDKQKSLTKTFFDSVSHRYYERHYGDIDKQTRYPGQYVRHKRVLELIDDLGGNPGTVLDVGCGTGVLVCELLKRGNVVFGVDLSESMIARSRQMVAEVVPDHRDKGHLDTGDAEHLDFGDSYFDIVVASGLAEYLESDELFFRECRRVLKPGGRVIISFRNRLFNAFSCNAYTHAATVSSDLADITDELVAAFRARSGSIEPEMMRSFASQLAGIQDRVLEEPAHVEREPGTWELSMSRRQHTPDEVKDRLRRAGMDMDRTIFWHFHPFPPPVVSRFPKLCREIGLAMEVLGETPIGALMASGFLVRAAKA